MDELELLKKDWKHREKDLPHFKAKELYPMLKKKSHSFIKWVFFISIGELALWTFLNIFLSDDKFWQNVAAIHLEGFTMALYIINYAVTLFFIFLFYKNYKAISVTDSVKQLMKTILKTRRVVKYYVLYELITTGIVSLLVFIFSFLYPPSYFHVVPGQLNWFKIIAIGLGVTVVIVGLLWIFYALLYGILLRKLKKNYDVLGKMELRDDD